MVNGKDVYICVLICVLYMNNEPNLFCYAIDEVFVVVIVL